MTYCLQIVAEPALRPGARRPRHSTHRQAVRLPCRRGQRGPAGGGPSSCRSAVETNVTADI